MKVIRKRLWAQEMTGNTLRWDVNCGCVQSWDGQTWRDNIQADPRFGIMYLNPPRTGTDIRCNSAANMIVKIQSMIDAIIGAATLIEMANAVFAVIAVFTPGFSLLMAFILAVCDALLAIGVGLISLAFDGDAYDYLTCIFAINLDAQGRVNETTIEDIKDQICAEMDATVCAVMELLLGTLGTVGLNNAGSSGDETGDCSDCALAWCNFTDFVDIQGDYIPMNYPQPGVYQEGTGWASQYVFVPGQYGGVYNCFGIETTIPFSFRSVTFRFDLSGSYNAGSSGVFIQYKFEGVWYTWGTGQYDPPVGTNLPLDSPDFPDGTQLTGVRFVAQLDSSTASIVVTKAQMRGFGTNPFTLGVDCQE